MIQSIMDQLTSPRLAQNLIEAAEKNLRDFALCRRQYHEVMCLLEEELGEAAVQERQAIQTQTVSNLLFSGMLGLKANLDNFINPMGRNFLDVDSEVYLREYTAHSLPEYAQADQAREEFFESLDKRQKTLYDAVSSYTSYLETVLPKLAHYYGYILGDRILPWVIPGYHSDPVLTARYTKMLNGYFAVPLV